MPKKPDPTTVAGRITIARLEAGLDKDDLARALGSKGTTKIKSWEDGKHPPSGRQLIRLCEILKVSADWILGLPTIMPKGTCLVGQDAWQAALDGSNALLRDERPLPRQDLRIVYRDDFDELFAKNEGSNDGEDVPGPRPVSE